MQQDPFTHTIPSLPFENRADAEWLLKHARNANLAVENGVVHFVDRTKPRPRPVGLTGITRALKALYWPSYNPFGGAKKPPSKKRRVAATPSDRLQSHQVLAHSHVKGLIVHRQLGEYYRYDEAHFKMRNPSGLHPLSHVALLALLQNHFLPLAFEFPVAHEESYMGTALDLVAVHEHTGRLAFFELKTSASRDLFVMDDPGVPFEGKLGECLYVDDRSALTRAKVQLAMGVAMLRRGHGMKKRPFDAYVLLVSEEGDHNMPTAELFEVPPAFYEVIAEHVYPDFVVQVPAWRKKNKEEKKLKDV